MDVKTLLKFFDFSIICLFLYFAQVESFHLDKTGYYFGPHNVALKRRQPTGLIPFPRVGKREFKKWRTSDLETMKRREGLIPFPRIGKSLDHSKGKLDDVDEFSVTWIGPRLTQDYMNSNDLNRKEYLANVLQDYMRELKANEKGISMYGSEKFNPRKSLDELILPEEVLMNPNNEPLNMINGEEKLQVAKPKTSNLANDGWHSINLEHVIE